MSAIMKEAAAVPRAYRWPNWKSAMHTRAPHRPDAAEQAAMLAELGYARALP